MSIANYAENQLLDAVFIHDAFCVTGDPYVSLHTGDPGETGLSVGEITSGTVPRIQVSFNAAVAGSSTNSKHAYFTSMPALTISHIGLWDAVSAGNHLWNGALTAAKIVNGGDTFELATTTGITVTLD